MTLSSPSGPSPQAWGTHLGYRHTCLLKRAIPTGVGNSGWGVDTDQHLYGPSPQAWGTPGTRTPALRRRRAIPTGVGNSGCSDARSLDCTGHPHRRGELPACGVGDAGGVGPSPQAWGTRSAKTASMYVKRAIPTGVGNSTPPGSRSRSPPGHPHRRGELHGGQPVLQDDSGPSPQAWGTRQRTERRWPQQRAIPTGVGNSRTRRWSTTRQAGHPHRRGELHGRGPAATSGGGPSPQAWGTRCTAH